MTGEESDPESRMPLHLAVRPGGACRVCGAPWPCEPQRITLAREYRHARTSLLVYLALHMIEAMEHTPATEAGHLYGRYLGWVPSADDWNGSVPAVEDARHGARAA
ncbi:hypothetical protein Aca07nite_88560 [Actinoplanes capillaceus]|uniref:Flavin reductase n=1 Tax=Actinoplanes campanulatus TaxID=113559 RepID=A0ABQ3WZG3_9ACTN|nr:hypothetical protein Aca07nite_88560 [Actinoplanes capillaceus]